MLPRFKPAPVVHLAAAPAEAGTVLNVSRFIAPVDLAERRAEIGGFAVSFPAPVEINGGPALACQGSPLVFAAPHEVQHVRAGQLKRSEAGTGTLAFTLAGLVGASAVCTADVQTGDPNWDLGSDFLELTASLAGPHGAVVGLHMMRPRGIEVCIGLGELPTQAEALWRPILDELLAAGLRVAFNWPYASRERTLTAQLQRRGLHSVELEISHECFDPGDDRWPCLTSALARAAARLSSCAPELQSKSPHRPSRRLRRR